jgi:lipoprotein-anchoring transpeptidase ErfK/SrfK
VKRLLFVALFASGFVAAGVFSGAVIADVTTSTATTTVAATTTAVTTTTAATTTVATTTTTVAPPTPSLVPRGVRVAGVKVAGLTTADAVTAVRRAFKRPLEIHVDHLKLLLDPTKVASAYATTAVAKARVSDRGTNVPLVVAVRGAAVRAWVANVARRVDREGVSATLRLTGGNPTITAPVVGRRLAQAKLRARVISALVSNSRLPVRVHTAAVQPTTTVGLSAVPTIVVNRSQNRLYLFDGTKLFRTFPVATGQAIYPTPAGTWHIVVKWKNPWWYPPTQDSWAKGLKPVPPGPGNPLGTRWMGLDASGVGIHGTDEPTSIGYSASHGCIRMQVPDAEWLFDHVDIGTTVYVV